MLFGLTSLFYALIARFKNVVFNVYLVWRNGLFVLLRSTISSPYDYFLGLALHSLPTFGLAMDGCCSDNMNANCMIFHPGQTLSLDILSCTTI